MKISNFFIFISLNLILSMNIFVNYINANKKPWWNNAVIYHTYIRSFADSNNDGIGDISGITSKLDYLEDLGIDAIWLSPCQPSPMKDFGYDITDYYAIESTYGTMQDFEELISQAKKRNIKIIMDLVLNHTSEKHPWFKESQASQHSLKRDWYLWYPPNSTSNNNKQEPNNWTSIFGGSAWEKDPTTDEFYYHFFFKEQPDLNYRNPEVYKEMINNIPNFWLNKGIAGFRLDATTNLFKDPELRNNPQTKLRVDGTWEQIPLYNCNLPEVHNLLKDLRTVTNKHPDTLLLGETESDQFLTPDGTDQERVERISKYFGDNDELHLVMNFFFSYLDKLSASDFKKQIELWDNNSAGGYPLYLFSNHDSVRHIDRYGDGKHDIDIAKLLGALLFTLRGSVQIYYGEEIGMRNNNPINKEDILDPVGKTFWPDITKCRDGARSPMQWDNTEHAGFSKAKPWLPIHSNYINHNVKAQEKDNNSLLNWYKKLIKLKKSESALISGTYKTLDNKLDSKLNSKNNNVLTYIRYNNEQTITVTLNFSNKSQEVILNKTSNSKLLLQHKAQVSYSNDNKYTLFLEPYGVYISSDR